MKRITGFLYKLILITYLLNGNTDSDDAVAVEPASAFNNNTNPRQEQS